MNMMDPWMMLGLDNCLVQLEKYVGEEKPRTIKFMRLDAKTASLLRRTFGLPTNPMSGTQPPTMVDFLEVGEGHMVLVEKGKRELTFHESVSLWAGSREWDAFLEYAFATLEKIDAKEAPVYIWWDMNRKKLMTIDEREWDEIEPAVIHALELGGKHLPEDEKLRIMEQLSREMKGLIRINEGTSVQSFGPLAEAYRDGSLPTREEMELRKKPCWGKGLSYAAAHCAPPVGDKKDGHACEGCPIREEMGYASLEDDKGIADMLEPTRDKAMDEMPESDGEQLGASPEEVDEKPAEPVKDGSKLSCLQRGTYGNCLAQETVDLRRTTLCNDAMAAGKCPKGYTLPKNAAPAAQGPEAFVDCEDCGCECPGCQKGAETGDYSGCTTWNTCTMRKPHDEKAGPGKSAAPAAPTEITDMTLDHVAMTQDGPKAGVSVKAKKEKGKKKGCTGCGGQGYIMVEMHKDGVIMPAIERCDTCQIFGSDHDALVEVMLTRTKDAWTHLKLGEKPVCKDLPMFRNSNYDGTCERSGEDCGECYAKYVENIQDGKFKKLKEELRKEMKLATPELFEMEKRKFWMCGCEEGDNVRPTAMQWCKTCGHKRDQSPAALARQLNQFQAIIEKGHDEKLNFDSWEPEMIYEFLTEVALTLRQPFDSIILQSELLKYGMRPEVTFRFVNDAWQLEGRLYGTDSRKLRVTMMDQANYETPPDKKRPCIDCKKPTDPELNGGRCEVCQALFIEEMLEKGKSALKCSNCSLVVDPEADDVHWSKVVTSINETSLCPKCRALSWEPVTIECPECHETYKDEDGCTAGRDARTSIEDHGRCQDCHDKWVAGNARPVVR